MYPVSFVEEIKDYLVAVKQTLAVAESVTSGHLQAAISLAAEASAFFQGGITAYNLGQKARHLHVNPIHATSCNCVSQVVADEMAVNANRLFMSDWALSVTGYATPLPEMGVKKVYCFYAIAKRDRIVGRGKVSGEGEGALNVQLYYTDFIIREFSRHLSGTSGNKGA